MPTTAAPKLWMPELDSVWLGRHRAHDVVDIVRRWKAVARRARMNVDVIHQTAGGPVIYVTSRRLTERPVYFCAGVHGDEAAAVQGLLVWAEARAEELRDADLAVFPLFNPAGIVLNTRADEGGHDLNRLFDSAGHPHMLAWQEAVRGLKPRVAVCLHEDYDARGLYCYELNRDPALKLADRLLESCSPIIPRDFRPVIEGRRALRGVIQRRRIPMITGLPEAVALYRAGAGGTLTFETPSEFDFALRTRVHARFAQSVWEMAETV
ncbi:MAG: succinylglutamate desuccinylase/aspartoacylase family protein [Verrucomicrobiota bacterium]